MSFDYGSGKWKRKRKHILDRDNYQCIWCRRYGRSRDAVEVHHLKPVETHPELAWIDTNLVSLCAACHRKAHPEKGGAARSRY